MTPSTAVEVMLNMPPLHVFIKQEVAAHATLTLKLQGLTQFEQVRHFNNMLYK